MGKRNCILLIIIIPFRFELAIEFLSATELDTLYNLFDKLEESLKSGQQDLAEQGVTEWSLSTLRRKYRV